MHAQCTRTYYLSKNLIKTVNILCQFYRQYFQWLSKFGWYLWKYLKINFIFYTVKLHCLTWSIRWNFMVFISNHHITSAYRKNCCDMPHSDTNNTILISIILSLNFDSEFLQFLALSHWFECNCYAPGMYVCVYVCVAHSHCVQNAHCWSWLVPFENERIFGLGICFQSVISNDAKCAHIATDPVNVWIQKRHTHLCWYEHKPLLW